MKAPRPARDTQECIVLTGPLVARLRGMALARGRSPWAQAVELLENAVGSWETDVWPTMRDAEEREARAVRP